MQKTPLTCATWIFSFPNSFAKLWLKARTPCFPAAKALVSGPPLKLAVAPVKIKVPLFPLDCSISLSLNAKMVAREKEKAAATPVCNTAWTSLGVMSRNFLKTGSPTLYNAARIVNSCLGYRAWMADQVEVMSSSEYDGVGKGVAYSLAAVQYYHKTIIMWDNAYFTTRGVYFFSNFVYNFIASSNKCNIIPILGK